MKRKGAARTRSTSSLQDEDKPEDNTEFGDLSIDEENDGDMVKTEDTVPDALDSLKKMEQDILKAGIKELWAA